MVNIKQTEQILMGSIFEVLEKMYYLFAEPSDSEGGDYHLTSTVHFEGPSSGTMALSLSRDVAETMAVNMLNMTKEEITETLMEDCAKEAANMICGNFVRQLDPEHIFQLSIPSVAVSGGVRQEENLICLNFTAEEGYIKVSLHSADLH